MPKVGPDRRRKMLTLTEIASDPRIYKSWDMWHGRMNALATTVYGNPSAKGSCDGIDLFGLDPKAVESRKESRGDFLTVRMLKQVANLYHATDDEKQRMEYLKQMETLSMKLDTYLNDHFKEIPKLYLSVQREAGKEKDRQLEAAKLADQSDEAVEAELIEMVGSQEALDAMVAQMENNNGESNSDGDA